MNSSSENAIHNIITPLLQELSDSHKTMLPFPQSDPSIIESTALIHDRSDPFLLIDEDKNITYRHYKNCSIVLTVSRLILSTGKRSEKSELMLQNAILEEVLIESLLGTTCDISAGNLVLYLYPVIARTCGSIFVSSTSKDEKRRRKRILVIGFQSKQDLQKWSNAINKVCRGLDQPLDTALPEVR